MPRLLEQRAALVSELVKTQRMASSASLFYFAKEVLGYDKLTFETHLPLCDLLQGKRGKKRHKLILLPRGTFKTTICTIAFTIWRLIRDPNERIMITSDLFDNATKYLFEIKSHYEGNEKFRAIFGDLVGRRWRDDGFDVANRTVMRKEENVFAASQDVTKVGYHADTIILDDIVTDKNTQNEEQMRKNLDYFRSLTSILEPGGSMYVVGTRWSFSKYELYQYIIDELSDEFDIYIRKAIEYNPDGTVARLYFPERFDEKTLKAILKQQGSLMFAAQYLNDPRDMANGMFRRIPTWQHDMDLSKSVGPLDVTITVDPSLGETSRADRTAIVICGTDRASRVYELDYIAKRMTPDELIEELFALGKMWRPRCIGIESVAFQKVLKYWLDAEMLRRKEFLPIVEIKHAPGRSKIQRVAALEPYFTRGQMMIRDDHTGLIDQLTAYPRCSYDDEVDALAMQLEILSTPPEEEKPPELTPEEIIEEKRALRKVYHAERIRGGFVVPEYVEDYGYDYW